MKLHNLTLKDILKIKDDFMGKEYSREDSGLGVHITLTVGDVLLINNDNSTHTLDPYIKLTYNGKLSKKYRYTQLRKFIDSCGFEVGVLVFIVKNDVNGLPYNKQLDSILDSLETDMLESISNYFINRGGEYV